MFLDFAKIKSDPEGILQPQKLIDLIEACKDDELYFIVPDLEGRGKVYLHAVFKDSYLALVAVLIQEGGAGKFMSDIGWGTYIGSVTTLLTLMVGEAMEQERIIDEADMPFTEDHEDEPAEAMPPISEADVAAMLADFENWNNANPDAPF